MHKNKIVLLYFVAAITLLYAAQDGLRVHTQKATDRNFEERLNIFGSAESAHVAKVSARIPGPIESIFVDEGDKVKANETVLFQIDSLKLEKNVQIRKQELSIARFSLREREANKKKAEVSLKKAESDMQRYRLLWEDNSISDDEFEKVQLQYNVSNVAVEHAQTLIDLGREQIKQAEIALAIAEKDLQDSRVLSPIDGTVVRRLQEPGEMAAPGHPILLVEDSKNIEIAAHVPGEYYNRIVIGETEVEIITDLTESFISVISFKSPVIMPGLRTFKVKCQTRQAKDQIISGALAEMSLILTRRDNLAVVSDAVITRSGSSAVFVVDAENVARLVKVETGLEYQGWTEILSGDLSEGADIVTQGQHLLNDGQKVTVIGKDD